MAVDVGSAKGYLDLDISGFLSGLRTAQSEADSTSKNVASKIGSNLSGVGKGLTSVGTTLTKNVTVPLLAVGTAGLKVATDFEKGMSEVKAISGATGKDFDALREKAIELGADTAFSAGEVAEAMTEMAKAGWNSQQIIDGMEGVLAAAAASGEGLATVSTIVADTITGFGLAASDSTKVADLLTQAANSGTIGITDLGESFKYIAPVAGAMGLSVEDVTTAISAMSMAGIKGSQAGTSLRTMLSRMVKPTDAVEAAMTELGISITNQDGTMKSLDRIVSNLRDSFDGLTESEKAKYAATLAGQEGMSGMLSLLNLTEEEYNAIAESMGNANGVAAETAAVMQDNLQSKIEQLGGSLESLAIKLSDYVIPYLQRFVSWLTELVDKFTNLDPEMQKTILKFAGIAAIAGPALVVLGKFTSGVGGLITTLGKAPGAISKLAGGISSIGTKLSGTTAATSTATQGATTLGSSFKALGSALAAMPPIVYIIIAIIIVLTAAFTTLWKKNEEFRDKIKEIWSGIVSMFQNFGTQITDKINSLGFNFENFGEILKALWTEFTELLAPIFIGAFQGISDTLKFILDTILATVSFFVSIFKGDWEGAWSAIKDFFVAHWTFIADFFKNVGKILTGILDVICSWFGTTWSDTWNSIKTFFVNTWNSIVTWFQNVLNDIATFFTNTWTSISTFFQNVWNGITSFISNAWETIKNVVQVGIMFIAELFKAAFSLITLPFRFIWENCKETIISILTSISNFISSAWNTISNAITVAITAIKTVITNVFNAISTFIQNIWNGIKAFLEPILNSIKTIAVNTWNGITSGISTALNSIKTFITNTWNTIKTFVTNMWNGIKSTASSIWNGIKDAISGPIDAAKTFISNIINSIKSIISNGFNSAKNTASGVFDSIKNSISNALESAKNVVKGAIDKIKGFFNFSWSLPKLKMPHFSITGSFSLNPPSVPKLSIEWYKKAMSGGMILNSPTIFGYDSKSGQFLGGGEAGSETVVGTASLMSMIRQAVNEAIQPVVAVAYKLANTAVELGYVTHNGFVKQAQVLDKVIGTNNQSGGDTFYFYSPKAIDEIEAAKQMKKTKRELAEGF